MGRTMRGVLVALTLAVGALAVAGPAAQADYAPFVTIAPAEGEPGTVIAVTPDYSGLCPGPYGSEEPIGGGTVTVEFGTLAQPGAIGGYQNLDEVLATTTVTSADDGTWDATVTVPEGTPAGEGYAVLAHCRIDGQLVYDYYPARFTVVEVADTTTSTTSATQPLATSTPVPAPAARAVEGRAAFTG